MDDRGEERLKDMPGGLCCAPEADLYMEHLCHGQKVDFCGKAWTHQSVQMVRISLGRLDVSRRPGSQEGLVIDKSRPRWGVLTGAQMGLQETSKVARLREKPVRKGGGHGVIEAVVVSARDGNGGEVELG